MQVQELWRYPVKSMQGERCPALVLDQVGVQGDRRYGVADLETGRVLSAKREGRLLSARATSEGSLRVTLPDGSVHHGLSPELDQSVSAWLQRPVRVLDAQAAGDGLGLPTFESQSDDDDDRSDTATWQGAAGSFVDSQPVHVLTTASLRAMQAQRPDLDWQAARFRPNILIDADGSDRLEDTWVGRRLVIGPAGGPDEAGVELEIEQACTRCVMVTRAIDCAEGTLPVRAERQLEILKYLSRTYEARIGVLARVVRGGPVTTGDTATPR